LTKPIIFIAAALFALCVVCRVPLERHMVTHVLLLLPALVAVGWLAGEAIARRWPSVLLSDWNTAGATGLLTASLAGAFWMLPRHLDWSLTEPFGEAAKFAILPVLGGIPLALSWPRAPLLVRGFLKANVISMALILAWVYTSAPVRLCTSYRTGEQEQLGEGFLLVAVVLGILWAAPALGVQMHPGNRARNPCVAPNKIEA
jgi:hypothetical protein